MFKNRRDADSLEKYYREDYWKGKYSDPDSIKYRDLCDRIETKLRITQNDAWMKNPANQEKKGPTDRKRSVPHVTTVSEHHPTLGAKISECIYDPKEKQPNEMTTREMLD